MSIHQCFRVVDSGRPLFSSVNSAQKMKLFMNDSFSKFEWIGRNLWIWLHLLTEEILHGKVYSLCNVKCWYLVKQRRNVYGPNIKRLTKKYYEPKRNIIVVFWVMTLQTNQKKSFKSHLEITETANYCRRKE